MDKKIKTYYSISIAYQLGLSLALPLILFIGGGIWLDKRLNLSPLCTLIGVVIGLAVSFISLYTQLKPFISRSSSPKQPPKSHVE